MYSHLNGRAPEVELVVGVPVPVPVVRQTPTVDPGRGHRRGQPSPNRYVYFCDLADKFSYEKTGLLSSLYIS